LKITKNNAFSTVFKPQLTSRFILVSLFRSDQCDSFGYVSVEKTEVYKPKMIVLGILWCLWSINGLVWIKPWYNWVEDKGGLCDFAQICPLTLSSTTKRGRYMLNGSQIEAIDALIYRVYHRVPDHLLGATDDDIIFALPVKDDPVSHEEFNKLLSMLVRSESGRAKIVLSFDN
jgi:hypothetical protein